MNYSSSGSQSKFFLLATFKSRKTGPEISSWLQAVAPAASASRARVILAPSFPYLNLPNWPSSILRAAQDVSPFPPGSYTGAVNAVQLAALGVRYCLVGHSERRRYFHETHSEIANKVSELLAQNITPVLCLSRPDVTSQLAALEEQDKSRTVFVYEPPAAIGGTETAPTQDISRVIALLRSLVPQRPILYGGSVNAGNLASLVTLNLAGVLVSTASLQSASFVALINRYQSLE